MEDIDIGLNYTIGEIRMKLSFSIHMKSLVLKHLWEISLFEGYSRMTMKYLARIALFDLTHMMSMYDLVAFALWWYQR